MFLEGLVMQGEIGFHVTRNKISYGGTLDNVDLFISSQTGLFSTFL